jgi:hypothetical protein
MSQSTDTWHVEIAVSSQRMRKQGGLVFSAEYAAKGVSEQLVLLFSPERNHSF